MKASAAEKDLDKAMKATMADKEPNYEVRRVLAQTMFQAQEDDFTSFMKISLADGSKIEKEVGAKNMVLKNLADRYQKVISLGIGEYTVASLFRLGQMHENLSQELFKAPVPAGASQAEVDSYRSSLEKAAFPLREDAMKFYETAYTRSQEVETFTEWTKLAYEKMVELEPARFKKVQIETAEPAYMSHSLYFTEGTKVLTE